MNTTETFTHDGKTFELRTAIIGNSHCIKVFHNNKEVSPVYSVSFETNADFFMQYHESLIDHLKALAKSDIEQGMYFKG